MKLNLTTLLLLLFFPLVSIGQTDSLKKLTQEKYVIVGDNMRYDYFEKSLPPIHWLLKNSPNFSESIQSWAMEAFEKVAEKTEDPTYKKVLLDSMIFAYKSKDEHFELSKIEKNKLAFRYFKYFLNDTEKLKEAYPFFKDLFSSPESAINNNLIPYMSVTEMYHKKVQPIEQAEILNVYMLSSSKVASEYFSNNFKRYQTYMAHLDNSLSNILGTELPCVAISRISDRLADVDSVHVAKKILSNSLNSSCGKTESYISALQMLSRNEPTPGIFKILAQYSAADKNFEEAILYYDEALALEEDSKKKADIHMDVANIHFINSNKLKAREHALEVLNLDPEQKAMAYSLIGNLYLSSFDDCADRYDIVQDKAVYLIAYDMFALAKDAKGMEEAQLRFPTREEAFNMNMDDGEPIDIGCWIQERTKLRTRVSN